MEKLVEKIYEKGSECIQIVKDKYLPLKVSPALQRIRREAKLCQLCHKPYNKTNRLPSLNHNHITGKFVSLICNQCNILAVKKSLVCISHSFGSTDGFLLLKHMKQKWLEKLKVVSRGGEGLLTLTWMDEIRFIDSSELLGFNIGELASRLRIISNSRPRKDVFKLLYSGFSDTIDCKVELLENNLIFPKRGFLFNNCTLCSEFPLIQEFCTEEEEVEDLMEAYTNSIKVYEDFNCNSMCSYSFIYTKWCVFQLADSLRHFVNYCLGRMNISPLHYSTLSAFGFDCAFAQSGASYEYIKDTSILEWIKPAIRAGLSFSNVRYAEANCERLNYYNGESSQRCHIVEFDLTSAYPACTADFLVKGEYAWLDDEDIKKLDLQTLRDDGEYGYIFEVSFSYPDEIHDDLIQLPLGVTKRIVSYDELSPSQKAQFKTASKNSSYMCVPKMIMDLLPKYNYLVTHRALKYYISKGIKIAHYHKGLRFKQEKYLKSAMEYFMELRKTALEENDEIMSAILKRLMCGIFGKFLTNSANHADVRICSTRTDCQKLTARHNFSDISLITNKLSLIHLTRGTVYHSYNILNAFLILENCKDLVYKGFDKFRSHFDGNVKLLAGETDSLRLQIYDPDNNFLVRMKQLQHFVDFSKLPKSHELYAANLKNHLGSWKLTELNIWQVVSIKSRLFSYITRCDKCYEHYNEKCDFGKVYSRGKIGAAGITKAKKKKLDHNYFCGLLFETGIPSESKDYNFNLLDTRRYFPGDSFSSLPHGHYRTKLGSSGV
jgi:hypothetical protein